uniref:40S ribosomal protein S11 n=1 Tax=Aegilops tauschii TaxID=37682 RepID=R7WEL8_AEGTA
MAEQVKALPLSSPCSALPLLPRYLAGAGCLGYAMRRLRAFRPCMLRSVHGEACVFLANRVACGIFATEKSFLKQPKVFLSTKKADKAKRPGKAGNRFWKSVGLGFKTPREAIDGTYIDKKCPFTGTVAIRGRIIAGTCHSAKMNRTIIVRRNYLHFVKKYEKRHSNIPAHISPCFRVKEGDHVIIGQCRPLSKTVRFNVLKVVPAGTTGGGKKAFIAA